MEKLNDYRPTHQNIEPEKPLEIPGGINPEITQDFARFIKEKSESGQYRVEVKIGDRIIPIDVFPTVFPPRSDYSISSKSIFELFGSLTGMEVADIGSGSGIESIIAIMAGAKHVDATDINHQAVDCSRHNIKINGLQENISVFHSDLFRNLPEKKYDLIIANLPIVNFDAGNNPINNALYDKGLELHNRLFTEAKNFLTEDGRITFVHANLQSSKTINPDYDFQFLERLIGEHGYVIDEKTKKEELGYRWVNYKIKLRDHSNYSPFSEKHFVNAPSPLKGRAGEGLETIGKSAVMYCLAPPLIPLLPRRGGKSFGKRCIITKP